ncbi:VWA domain-containing protein [Candidatus Woesearchaeota archaeon]|nr:VWA domain-containing protein [Candidatus Woesearchaeota archaeon]
MTAIQIPGMMTSFGLKYPLALFAYIPIAIIIIVLVKKQFLKSEEVLRKRFDRAFLIFSRLLIFLLLVIAIANPYQFKETTVTGDASVLILRDNSTSFSLFDSQEIDKLVDNIRQHIPVTEKFIGYGERSAIGDGILTNMQGDDNLLVITDGNNNQGRDLGDMVVFASLVNTTINTLKLEPDKKDTSVFIEGPSQSIVDTESEFFVEIAQVGGSAPYTLTLKLDGKEISSGEYQGERVEQFSKVLEEGYHQIVAIVDVEDHFEENNIFYKTVHVLPKPNILYVTNKDSPMFDSVANIYNVHMTGSLPSDLAFYHAVILDDIPAERLEEKIDLIRDYISDGNGLMVIGGQNSYEYGGYQGARFETLLPARVGTGDEDDDGDVNVVILVDISGSTGIKFREDGTYTTSDVEKALAVEIMDSLRSQDKVSVVAFNTNSYLVEPLSPIISKDMDMVKERIRALKYDGGTYIYSGMKRATSMLRNKEGSRNMILISDGDTLLPQNALSAATYAAALGITTYSVGVGQGTVTEFMQRMASEGKGSYFEPEEAEKLAVVFGKGEEEEVEEAMELVILDGNHFITANLGITASVTGYNQVIPKSSSRLLVSTELNNPILTVWRFGLGRVAALSTDSGAGWSGQLLSEENAALITRMVNWAVGDMGRNQDFSVDVEDTHLGNPTYIYVTADQMPESEDLEFSKVGERRYVAEFIPDTTGFSKFFDAYTAVNYNKEYRDTGMNPEFRDLVTVTGGKVLDPSKPEEIVEKIKKDSQRKRLDYVYYSWIFAASAIAVFLVELLIRRLRENKNLYGK